MPANGPPEDALWLQDIEEQLVSLMRTAQQRWQRIAALLIDVETQALWQGAAASYTAWVQGVAVKAGVQASGLWRMLKAGQVYNRLRNEQLAAQPAAEAAMPELAKLESSASPESLELLDKISRAASPERTQALFNRTLAGQTKREELRQTWLDYRPAVSGTARGRRRAGLGQAFAGQVEALAALRADMVQAVRASRGGFIDGRTDSHQWRVQTDVILPAASAQPMRFDAVCAELAAPEQAKPGLHGLFIRAQRSDLPNARELLAAADYVDTLWLAAPAALSDAAPPLAPAGVGLLAFQQAAAETSGLSVLRPASELSRQADLRGELALALLKRLL